MRLEALPLLLLFGVILPPISNDFESTLNSTLLDDGLTLEASSNNSIEIIGAWGKRDLSIILIPHSDPRLNEWALEAMNWWRLAIPVFTVLYGYRYLESLEFTFYVKGVNGSAGDITVRYVDTLGSTACGQTFIQGYDGQITRAEVRLSLRCISNNKSIAMIVAAHEFGHALGLGHTENCSDIMCEFVVMGARPSTLDIYGLAVAYEWLRAGSFRPPERLAVMPDSIPMINLLDADGLPIKLKVSIYRSVDDGPLELIDELYIDPGQDVVLTAQQIIRIDEYERLRFNGWQLDGEVLLKDPTITLRPKSHVKVVEKYITQFWVSIITSRWDDVVGWFDKGTRITIDLPSIVPLSSDTRLRFDGWEGNISVSGSSLEIVVNGSIRLRAIWVKQYLVRVESDYGVITGAGWYDEGTVINISLDPSLIHFGNRTRLVLKGFRDSLEYNGSEVSLIIDGPKNLTAIWVLQYLVEIRYTHGEESKISYWVDAGETIVTEARAVIEWPNATRAVFREWSGDASSVNREIRTSVDGPLTLVAVYEVEYFVELRSFYDLGLRSGWFRRNTTLALSVPKILNVSEGTRAIFMGWGGDVSSLNTSIRVVVDKPLSVRADWFTEHLVVVDYPEPLRGYKIWVANGTELEVTAPAEMLTSPTRMLEFYEWSGYASSNERELMIIVKEPVYLKARYLTLIKAEVVEKPSLEGFDRVVFEVIGPGNVTLTIEGGTELWLREGKWKIESATWRGIDVKSAGEFETVEGLIIIPVKIALTHVRVIDALNMPAPWVSLVIEREDGVVETETATNLLGEVPQVPVSYKATKIRASYPFMESSEGLELLNEGITLRIALSPYSLATLIIGSVVTLRILRLRRRRVTTPPQRLAG